jgi:hypothetical protein
MQERPIITNTGGKVSPFRSPTATSIDDKSFRTVEKPKTMCMLPKMKYNFKEIFENPPNLHPYYPKDEFRYKKGHKFPMQYENAKLIEHLTRNTQRITDYDDKASESMFKYFGVSEKADQERISTFHLNKPAASINFKPVIKVCDLSPNSPNKISKLGVSH